MGPGECNSFTLTLLACLMVTPCVPTILTPAVLAFLLLYNLWFEHHSGNSPINQVYTVTGMLLQFREYKSALQADIRKAFFMVAVNPEDRPYLRFLSPG